MSRNAEQKVKLLVLYDILQKNTDDNHPMTTGQITAALKNRIKKGETQKWKAQISARLLEIRLEQKRLVWQILIDSIYVTYPPRSIAQKG